MVFLLQLVLPIRITSSIYEVYIPPNAQPQRLTFSTEEQSSVANQAFDLSIHVLQIHRAALNVIDPVPSEQSNRIQCQYNTSNSHTTPNPGNGDDTYQFEAKVVPTETISEQDVEFTYYNPVRTLGILATTIMPLDIELSETLPAAQPFYLEFEWESMVNKSLKATTALLIEAEQRHEWDIVVVGSQQQSVQPSIDHLLEFNITNTGNFLDNVQLIPTLSITTDSNDSAVWQPHLEALTSTMLEVNSSTTLKCLTSHTACLERCECEIIVPQGCRFGICSRPI